MNTLLRLKKTTSLPLAAFAAATLACFGLSPAALGAPPPPPPPTPTPPASQQFLLDLYRAFDSDIMGSVLSMSALYAREVSASRWRLSRQ